MLAGVILVAGLLVVVAAVVATASFLRAAQSTRLKQPREAARHVSADLGRIPAALAVAGALSAVVVAICWPLGRLAARSQHGDQTIYDWVPKHQFSAMTSVMKRATLMGNRFEIKIVMAVVCIGFLIFLRRRAGLVILAILGSFVLERYLQKTLALVIHRGHPPTTLGTYPSGGTARLISIYGLILYLVLRYWRPGRRIVVAAWSTLAALAWIEGYSRIYLEKHWASDVVGGWIFGVLLLGTLVSTVWVLLDDKPKPDIPIQNRAESDELGSVTTPAP